MATTREYTDYLNDQIDIAPANSQEELQAAEIIEELFVQHGLETQIQEFEAPSFSGLTERVYLIVLFIGVLLSGFLGTPVALIGLVLAIMSFVLLFFAHNGTDPLGSIGPRATSQNVIGVHRATGPNVIKGNRPIVIVAHYDTPRENFLNGGQLAKWQPLIKRLSWPFSVAVIVFAIMQVVGIVPPMVRHVFWVFGVLLALPLLLLGASAVYERFAPCTTGASDNKSSVAAMLGVLDMVRPENDAAKEWAADHPKGVRRTLDDEQDYDDDQDYEDDSDEQLEYYDEPSDQEPVDERDEEDDEGIDQTEVEVAPVAAAVPTPVVTDTAGSENVIERTLEDEDDDSRDEGPSEDEYGLVSPSTVRRGAAVLENLQVLPETCEIVYEHLIPREEAIEMLAAGNALGRMAEQSEGLGRIKDVAGNLSESVGNGLVLARDWAANLFDTIRDFFMGIVDRLLGRSDDDEIEEVEAELIDADEDFEYDEVIDDIEEPVDEFDDRYLDDDYDEEVLDDLDEYEDVYDGEYELVESGVQEQYASASQLESTGTYEVVAEPVPVYGEQDEAPVAESAQNVTTDLVEEGEAGATLQTDALNVPETIAVEEADSAQEIALDAEAPVEYEPSDDVHEAEEDVTTPEQPMAEQETAVYTPQDIYAVDAVEEPVVVEHVVVDKPWKLPPLELVDAEFEILGKNGSYIPSVPVEVVDVPSINVSYDIPGIASAPVYEEQTVQEQEVEKEVEAAQNADIPGAVAEPFETAELKLDDIKAAESEFATTQAAESSDGVVEPSVTPEQEPLEDEAVVDSQADQVEPIEDYQGEPVELWVSADDLEQPLAEATLVEEEAEAIVEEPMATPAEDQAVEEQPADTDAFEKEEYASDEFQAAATDAEIGQTEQSWVEDIENSYEFDETEATLAFRPIKVDESDQSEVADEAPEKSSASILHEMFETAPYQKRYSTPTRPDVLHEMFAAMPAIEQMPEVTAAAATVVADAAVTVVENVPALEESGSFVKADEHELTEPETIEEQSIEVETEPEPEPEPEPQPEIEQEQVVPVEQDVDTKPVPNKAVESLFDFNAIPIAEFELAPDTTEELPIESISTVESEEELVSDLPQEIEPQEQPVLQDKLEPEVAHEDETAVEHEIEVQPEPEPDFEPVEASDTKQDEPAEAHEDQAVEVQEEQLPEPELPEEPEATQTENAEQTQSSDESTLMEGLTFSTEADVSEEDLNEMDVTGLTTMSAEVQADIEDSMPAVVERIPKPRAVDDPTWGKTTFKPQVVSAGRRAMLLDLPDPSVMAVDPLLRPREGDVPRVTTTQDSEELARRFEVLRKVPSPLDDPSGQMPATPATEPAATEPAATEPAKASIKEEPKEAPLPRYNKSKPIGDRAPKKNSKRKIRFGRKRTEEEQQPESMGEWLGLNDDYDAKKDGRQIGSWDNFDDSNEGGKWKGGATLRAGLRYDDEDEPMDISMGLPNFDSLDLMPSDAEIDDAMFDEVYVTDPETMEELREAILSLGDDELISHDIWFVGVGASTLNHAGIKAFLDEHRRDIRGAFLVNLDSIGAGKLTLLTSEGMGKKSRADRRMGRLITNIADALHIELGRADYSWDETDATPAMQRSVRVGTLAGMSEDGIFAHSHTNEDEPEYLNDQQIADVADIVAELIRRS